MAAIRWTDEALHWLVEIYDHIAKDNPQAAQRVVDGISARADILEQFPEIGSRLHEPEGRDIRILLYGHYRIAYVILPSGDVDIIGVYHGALDITRHLP